MDSVWLQLCSFTLHSYYSARSADLPAIRGEKQQINTTCLKTELS